MQRRLLQSFLTHILEEYMLPLRSEDDVPGIAWSSRFMEKMHPERIIPGKETFADRFEKTEALADRLATVGSIVALAQDLEIDSKELFEAIMDPKPENFGDEDTEDEPPSSSMDIPISKSGALLLLAARKAVETLYDRETSTPSISIFPDHAAIIENFIGNVSQASSGLEPESLIDTVLFFGLVALENNAIGEPTSDEAFNQYLQNTSLLSANTPSPTLRYHAHYLTSTVLRSHPHDLVRLSFIRDTLEHCPYENLKTSAVGWLKGETIEANSPNAPPPEAEDHPSIFATPVALSTVSPFLFQDFTERLTAPSLSDSYMQFKADLGFYLAALNFYYLLLIAKHLHEPLDVAGLHQTSDIAGSYLEPLRQAAKKYREGLKEGGELYEGEEDVQGLMELGILEDAVGRVEDGVKRLNKA